MNAPIKLLVVDDVEPNLTAVGALLARPGVTLLTASSGAQALELLLEHDVALALIDVQMPGMNGFELAELMRGSERTRAIPLIFLTAAARDQAYTFRGYEAGAVDFLFKPFDGQVLVNKVNVFVELYQQKRQLSAQLDELKRSLHLNELFTAVLGHDLRTPLSVVMNGAMLLPMMTDHPKVAITAQRIQSSARRMAQMVDQLLDLARIRSGAMRPELAEADFGALCRLLADEFSTPDQPSRISVETSGDLVGVCDSGMLSQVLSNLMGNALTHGEPASPVRVTVDGNHPEAITVSVANRGQIDAQLLGSVFEPYKRGASRKSGQGLGLGLYTARMFIVAHGGDITAASDKEEGTVFTFKTPRRAASEPRP